MRRIIPCFRISVEQFRKLIASYVLLLVASPCLQSDYIFIYDLVSKLQLFQSLESFILLSFLSSSKFSDLISSYILIFPIISPRYPLFFFVFQPPVSSLR